MTFPIIYIVYSSLIGHTKGAKAANCVFINTELSTQGYLKVFGVRGNIICMYTFHGKRYRFYVCGPYLIFIQNCAMFTHVIVQYQTELLPQVISCRWRMKD